VVGINVTAMGLLAFAIGGALGGLAGVLVTPIQQVSFDTDVLLVVNGFSAAILGNLTRPTLTLAGGLVLGVVQALTAGYLSTSYQSEVALVFMLAILIVQAGRQRAIQEEAS
jgi:branched-chain amino acid transport system permease protein